jgi:hypothetical protein
MSAANLIGTLRRMARVLTLGAALAAFAGCGVEAGAEYPAGGYEDYPPDAYIATAEPVYYEGNAAYWYGGFWYYRQGGHWNHYDREPAGLYQRRGRAMPSRHVYEPVGRAAGRPGGRSGGRR